LIYALGLIVAYLVNRAVPLWIATPEARALWWLGVVVAVAGISLSLSGIIMFRRHRTAVNPTRPASTVVTTGPYRFTRNPMYLGLAVFSVGVALLLDTWWALIALPFVLFVVNRAVIAREERYLASAFGAEYDAYRAATRRWL
jgi:protein-S-isoprenylcysteine O-methyltransferase Ste14